VLQREVGVPSMIVLLVGGRSLPPSRLSSVGLAAVGMYVKGRRRTPARLQGKYVAMFKR
jgi:hypothetical protein